MKIVDGTTYLSASDLSTFIACPHATLLNLEEARGLRKAPANTYGALQVLQRKGQEFEHSYLEKLRKQGKRIAEIGNRDRRQAAEDTLQAMAEGVDIIYQARLELDIWNGWADFLVKADQASNFGVWCYEVMDTKLSRETKAGAILQICMYSEILRELQGCKPEYMYINNPNGEHRFRVDDFMAFYRLMKNKLLQAITVHQESYPEPVAHCDICKWWEDCNKQRRKDDHLSFIAGMGKQQIREVKEHGVTTLASMAELHSGIPWKPDRGSLGTYERLAHQADLQLQWRTTNHPVFETLPMDGDFGFFKLPEPSLHDVFFDFEGDPFVGANGLEYLFGWLYQDHYYDLWAKNDTEEKQALEDFMDGMMKILDTDSGMHIYHFGAYEQTALKRLVGKYVTKEEELDRLLRAGVFVNLHGITRHAIIAGVESYSLKDLEKLHGYSRQVDLRTVASHKLWYEGLLESGSIEDVADETKSIVRTYNEDDCISTKYLRNWLEQQRAKLISQGASISRPQPGDGDASKNIREHQQRIQPLFDALMRDLPVEKENRTEEEQANWLLANMLDWYRREKKSFWWDVYRLRDLTDEELLEERDALSGLKFTGKREPEKKSFVEYYTFPEQETTLETGNKVEFRKEKMGEIYSIDHEARIVGIKKKKSALNTHPTNLLCVDVINDDEKIEAIIRFAERVIRDGIDGNGSCRAGRGLLLRKMPRTKGIVSSTASAQDKATQWAHQLDHSVLPIQGPPGTGKSHTAAKMIVSLVKAGKKIGITALSHKVIKGLLEKVVAAARNENFSLQIVQKVSEEPGSPGHDWNITIENKDVVDCLKEGYHIAAGTSFMWAREDLFESVDYLFVDEAGQLSLIDTIALSHAAKNLILLGDPQQLKQPLKGSHPEGTEVSALEHILQGKKTIEDERGVFLDKTWRMHPAINEFISELFYDCKLQPKKGNELQTLQGNTKFKQPGIYFEPAVHFGNQNSSPEEVEKVKQIVDELMSSKLNWINTSGQCAPLTADHIKIISPYNAQVNALRRCLRIDIGTVDKFQGQEAPVIILSMATSTPEDAPRGMEFLYSLNRLNVAVSRARGVFILVANPKLFEPDCRSPHQMQLANAICRLRELAL